MAWDLERRSCSREEKWEERSFQRRVQVVRREDCFSNSSKLDWIGFGIGAFGGQIAVGEDPIVTSAVQCSAVK